MITIPCYYINNDGKLVKARRKGGDAFGGVQIWVEGTLGVTYILKDRVVPAGALTELLYG